MSASAKKILLVEDDRLLRRACEASLRQRGFAVVPAMDGEEGLRLARSETPDLILLDLLMPRLPGIEVLRALNGVPLATRTILLTANIERDEVVKALQLGARGLVMKDSASELLMKAMRMVMAGQYWIGRESVSGLVETLRTQMFASSEPKFGLTPRELEIVAAVAAGYSNKEMAQRFSLSQETVKHHLTRIYNKLHVTIRLELALFAISQHLAER